MCRLKFRHFSIKFSDFEFFCRYYDGQVFGSLFILVQLKIQMSFGLDLIYKLIWPVKMYLKVVNVIKVWKCVVFATNKRSNWFITLVMKPCLRMIEKRNCAYAHIHSHVTTKKMAIGHYRSILGTIFPLI